MLIEQSTPARGLREVIAVRKTVDALERALILEARRRGASWRELGELLGITHQSVWKRFRAADPRPARQRTELHDAAVRLRESSVSEGRRGLTPSVGDDAL